MSVSQGRVNFGDDLSVKLLSSLGGGDACPWHARRPCPSEPSSSMILRSSSVRIAPVSRQSRAATSHPAINRQPSSPSPSLSDTAIPIHTSSHNPQPTMGHPSERNKQMLEEHYPQTV